MEQVWQLLFILLPAAAFLYASVGHGGASSYLMFLALFNFPQTEARPTALILNIIVSLLAFLSHRRTCEFPTRLFLSFALFSIPAAFVGGSIEIDTEWYRRILGILLVFPVLRFFNVFPQAKEHSMPLRWWIPPILAIVIGFFSGLIGIGGGIILSPVLLMLGWASIRETATMSALFIFVNSIAGLVGAGIPDWSLPAQLWALMPLTIAAGALGAYYGAQRFNVVTVRYLLATVLVVASVKLIFG